MRTYAILTNNVVFRVEELSEVEAQERMQSSLVIDITDISPQPAALWQLVGNTLQAPPSNPVSAIDFVRYSIYKPALAFSQSLIENYVSENIALGITQAGKTKQVGEKLQKLVYWLQLGSLYEVLSEIEALKVDLDPALAPYITEARLNEVKSKVRSYLGLPQ